MPVNPIPQASPTTPAQAGTRRLAKLWALLWGAGARDGYLAAADQGLISATNFLATILIARSVSPTDLGMYGVGFTTLRLARVVQDGLVIQPLNVFGAGMDERNFKHYATSTTIIQLMLALLSSALVALGGWVLTELGNDTAGPTLFALWSAFLFWQLQEYFRRILYTRGKIPQALATTLLANAARLGMLVWWILQGKLTGLHGLDAISWGAAATILLGVWFTRSFWSTKPEGLLVTLRRNWVFGRWVMGGTLANWFAVEFYPVMTAGLVSFAAAGAYRALQNLVAPVHLLLRATDTFLTPRASRLYTQHGRKAMFRSVRLIYVFTGAATLILLSLAVLLREPLLKLLYGNTYLPYSRGILLMAVFYGLWYAYWPLQTAFKAARLTRPIFLANLAAILTMVTVGIFAVSHWGVYGTIAGQALNALVLGVILWAIWLKFSKETPG